MLLLDYGTTYFHDFFFFINLIIYFIKLFLLAISTVNDLTLRFDTIPLIFLYIYFEYIVSIQPDIIISSCHILFSK